MRPTIEHAARTLVARRWALVAPERTLVAGGWTLARWCGAFVFNGVYPVFFATGVEPGYTL